jgi:hypothetical protein
MKAKSAESLRVVLRLSTDKIVEDLSKAEYPSMPVSARAESAGIPTAEPRPGAKACEEYSAMGDTRLVPITLRTNATFTDFLPPWRRHARKAPPDDHQKDGRRTHDRSVPPALWRSWNRHICGTPEDGLRIG